MSQQELPLFPLNTVMFPGASLTLHIFEQRYRDMIGQCLDEGRPFGVLLIREGWEVGDPALPHPVGTVVQISASVRLEDGRLLIATVGQQRFRLEETIQSMPYMVGAISLLPDDSNSGLAAVSEELRTIYQHYWQAMRAATGVQHEVEELPAETIALSYHLAHRLQVTNERKQHWLETDTTTRMREIRDMLRAEIRLLPGGSGSNLSSSSSSPWSWN
jgi:hypothetical protein